MHYFLVLDIWQRKDEIFLSQGKYIVDILHIFGMVYCKSMNTPMDSNFRKLHETDTGSNLVDSTLDKQLIGSLMYLIHSRPYIFYAVSILSKFMIDPRHKQWVAGKHILRYLHGTVAYGLRYASNGGVLLVGFTNYDWVATLLIERVILVTVSVWVAL